MLPYDEKMDNRFVSWGLSRMLMSVGQAVRGANGNNYNSPEGARLSTARKMSFGLDGDVKMQTIRKCLCR